MASLKRFPDSRYWFAVFLGPNGKQRACSTKEVDKRRAQRIADRFELAARMARLGGLAARHRWPLNHSRSQDRRACRKGGSPQERRPFTDREIRAILAAADPEWYGMVLCGLYHGFRLGDVADLTWLNVDLVLRQFRFDTEKTSRATNVPIAEPLYRYLMELAGDDPAGPLFPRAHALRARGVGTGALSNQFGRIMAKAGVVEKRSNQKQPDGQGRSGRRQSPGLGFHCFRYTATSLLKRAGVSDAVAREIIGHESAAVSRLYTDIDDATLRGAFAKMPDLTQ
jgi:integrase